LSISLRRGVTRFTQPQSARPVGPPTVSTGRDERGLTRE